MIDKAVIKRIQEIFEEKLKIKTSWGRNDVMNIYKEAIIEAMTEFM